MLAQGLPVLHTSLPALNYSLQFTVCCLHTCATCLQGACMLCCVVCVCLDSSCSVSITPACTLRTSVSAASCFQRSSCPASGSKPLLSGGCKFVAAGTSTGLIPGASTGVTATLAQLKNPNGVAVNSAGDVFIADAPTHTIKVGDGPAAGSGCHSTDWLRVWQLLRQ